MPSDTSPPSSNRGTTPARQLLGACRELIERTRYILAGSDLDVDRACADMAAQLSDFADDILSTVESRVAGDPPDDDPVPHGYRFAGGR